MKPALQIDSPFSTAKVILELVRHPEAIFLTGIEHDPASLSAVGRFICPRSPSFPGPEIGEITGGQIFDCVAQMAYCMTGLLIRDGVDLLGLNFDHFKRQIAKHKINIVKSNLSFRRRASFDCPISITGKIVPFRDGRMTRKVLDKRRHTKTCFINLSFEAWQQSQEHGAGSVRVFQGHLMACHQAGIEMVANN